MVIIRFESDRKSVITATLPNNQHPDLSRHIIFNSNETMTEMNTHIKMRTLRGLTRKTLSVRESEELRSNTTSGCMKCISVIAVWARKFCLKTISFTLTFCHHLFLFLDADSLLQRNLRHVCLSPNNHGLILQELFPRLQSQGTSSPL